MSDTPNLDELRTRVRVLHQLLQDAHPGLLTWRENYAHAVSSVLSFFAVEGTQVPDTLQKK